MSNDECKCGHGQEQDHAKTGCLPGGTLRERLDKLGPELGRMLAADLAEIERR